jgi:uncharacterized protein (DUF608 family)
MEDIIRLFPEKKGLKTTKQVFEASRRMNPKIIMEMLNIYLLKPYEEEILSDNFEFFINKDYAQDIAVIPRGDAIKTTDAGILKGIDSIRQPLNELPDEDKLKMLQYYKNLIQLTTLYETSKHR